MKNVFITGATSFIGVNLINKLLSEDYNVFAIIRQNSSKKNQLPKSKNLSIIELDMENIVNLPNLTDKKCDVFYHLAWNGTRGFTRDDKELQESNYNYSVNVLKTAINMGTSVFISAGSQAEYGLHENQVLETTEEVPVTEYGKAKLEFCNFAKDYCLKNNVRFIEPRFFSLYGYGDFENTLIISIISKMLKNEDVDLTECIQLWNFLHIDDAVNALIKLQESNVSGVFNFGSDDTRILKDFIFEIYKLTNSKSKLNFGVIPYANGNIINVNPSIKKLRKSINWEPVVSFQKGVQSIIERSVQDEKN